VRFHACAEAPFRPRPAGQRCPGDGPGLRRPVGRLLRRDVPAQLSRFDDLAARLSGRTPRVETDPSYGQAAVALVCVRNPEAILLIRRAERAGDPWSGQMGLPGGRRGPEDPDLQATAIREAAEEVGLPLDESSCLGVLDDLTPRSTLLPRLFVRPFVFQVARPHDLAPNHEVASVHWIGLDRFLVEGAYGIWDVEASGVRLRHPGYRLPEGIVWGMTERILTPFLETLAVSSR
jgi:8-oxo-dGTP pyrophosphatase MutT (NUDIX family)